MTSSCPPRTSRIVYSLACTVPGLYVLPGPKVTNPSPEACRDSAWVISRPAAWPAGPGPALVHADAYRLGSSLELDDLDLDADTATSVTVVEWGEGLAEGLAADRLEIAIAPVAGAGSAGLDDVHGSGGSESPDDSEAWDDLDGDSPRTVRISGVGERWHDIKLPPADLADRL